MARWIARRAPLGLTTAGRMMARRKRRDRPRSAIRTAGARTNLDCALCGDKILAGAQYRFVNRAPRHYNSFHYPACHNPHQCRVCLTPGTKAGGAMNHHDVAQQRLDDPSRPGGGG